MTTKDVEEVQEEEQPEKEGSYFLSDNKDVEFISTGSTLLDCAAGGGIALGRMVNIVGNKSAGKTLVCIEACANFHKKYPNSPIWYNETEAAFDEGYADAIGMPVESITFVQKELAAKKEKSSKKKDVIQEVEDDDTPKKKKSDMGDGTIEGFFEHLSSVVKTHGDKEGLYILDSLDALSDRAEKERAIDDGSFGANKAKKASELFRRLIADLSKSKITLIIVSQIRDNIGASMGEKHTRSGGRALDFYASQVIWLTTIKKLKRTVKKVERPYGVLTKGALKKNKVGMPFRECQFTIDFAYGINDLISNLEWLMTTKVDFDPILKEKWQTPVNAISTSSVKRLVKKVMDDWDDENYHKFNNMVQQMTKDRWKEIETEFLPKRRKY